MDYLVRFERFIERVISSKYSDRWKSLFRKGAKGWAKIDIWQAWNSDFSNIEKEDWNDNIKELVLFLKKNRIEFYMFYGIGDNKPIVIEDNIDGISKSLSENIEGIYLFDNEWALINNHNGEMLIFKVAGM